MKRIDDRGGGVAEPAAGRLRDHDPQRRHHLPPVAGPARRQELCLRGARPPQDNTLELQSYENLVRGQLARLGFHEAPQAPALKVAMRFITVDVPTQVLYPRTRPSIQYDPY